MQKAKCASAILTEKEIKTQNNNFKKHIKPFEDDGDTINWETTVELDITAFFGIQANQNKKDSYHKLTLPTLIKVLAVTRTEDCNSKRNL